MNESTTPATYHDPMTQRIYTVELLQDEETQSLIMFTGEKPSSFAEELWVARKFVKSALP